jgi:hypothetical protein
LPIACNLKRTEGCETNGCLSLSTKREQQAVKLFASPSCQDSRILKLILAYSCPPRQENHAVKQIFAYFCPQRQEQLVVKRIVSIPPHQDKESLL